MPASSVLKVARTRAGYLLRVEGKGTLRESPAVSQFAERVLNEPGNSLAFDLSSCDYLDSTFQGCLVVLHKRFDSGPSPRVLIAASPQTRDRLLRREHLDQIFSLTDASPEAVGEDLTLPTLALDSVELAQHVMECHRRLAEVDGPSCQAFAEVADQLERELVQPGPPSAAAPTARPD